MLVQSVGKMTWEGAGASGGSPNCLNVSGPPIRLRGRGKNIAQRSQASRRVGYGAVNRGPDWRRGNGASAPLHALGRRHKRQLSAVGAVRPFIGAVLAATVS